MRILLVNDDGINAVGLNVMAETFCKEHDVCVVAPESERSGFSHSVTIFRNMHYAKTQHEVESYSVSGTPADCVKFGVIHLFKDRKPDLVLSGINSGPNIGSDIMYSGTVAAASEAVFLGIPAIAVSLGGWLEQREHFKEREYYLEAAEFVKRNLENLYGLVKTYTGELLLNVNYPVNRSYKGAVFSKAGLNWYDDYFDTCETPGVVQLKGMPVSHKQDETDCDVAWIKKGYAVITPLRLDRNHYEVLERCKDQVKLR